MDDEKKKRLDKVYALKDHWKELIEAQGVDFLKAYYYPKPVIKAKGKDPYVNFFPTELARGEVLYTEPVDFSMNTETPRKLYIYNPNPFYEQEYEFMTTRAGDQYAIPFAELIEVKMPEKKVAPILKTIIEVTEDINVSELTARDWACIHLKVPGSTRGWLNDLIKEALKK